MQVLRKMWEDMGVWVRNFMTDTMQASCLSARAALSLFGFLLIFPLFSFPAAAEDILGSTYSPASQAELRAAREERKKMAHSRIQEIIQGKEGVAMQPSVPLSSPKPTVSTPAPLIPPQQYYTAAPPPSQPASYQPVSQPYIPPALPPAVAPVTLASPHPSAIVPPPPTGAVYTPVAAPIIPAAPAVVPPPPLAPVATEVALPPPPTDTPWQEVSPQQAPKENLAADTSKAAEASPAAGTLPQPPVKEGVIVDRTFILNPLEAKKKVATEVAAIAPAAEAEPVITPESPPVAEEQLLPEVAAALAEATLEKPEELSPETKQILDGLPAEIIGRPKTKELPKDVSMDRVDPATAMPKTDDNKETTSSSQSLGMDVAIKQRPVDVDYELEKAYMALVGGSPEEAIGIYKSVLDIDPHSIPALFGLATTYHRVGLLDEARPVYGKLLKLDPKNKDAINNFLVLVGEEAPERALEHMKFLENQNPEFAPIPAQMALLYSKLGDTEGSIRSMQRAVNLSPENLVYKYNLAILYDKAEKPVEASILYRQLLEARFRGENIPADADQIQQRLTFLLSNK